MQGRGLLLHRFTTTIVIVEPSLHSPKGDPANIRHASDSSGTHQARIRHAMVVLSLLVHGRNR